MIKFYIFILSIILINLNILHVRPEKKEIKKLISNNNLEWENVKSNFENDLNWSEVDQNETYHHQIKIINTGVKSNIFSIRSRGKAVTVNGFYYPDISNYVPNAFVEDPNKIFGISSRGISKTRFCSGRNFSKACIDGVLDFDFKLLNNNFLSIYPKINMQSLTSRGTNFGEGISMGVKIAKEISPYWSIAFGGENILHFDDTIDLGHNFFVVASTYVPITISNNSSIFFLNAGIGSDFYGYKGNGFLFRTPCGKNTLTGTIDEPNSCSWGPIASAALAINDRLTIISEWFGYSYGIGFSLRPFKEENLSISFLASDFINGFPIYAKDFCTNGECETRFYGSISLNF